MGRAGRRNAGPGQGIATFRCPPPSSAEVATKRIPRYHPTGAGHALPPATANASPSQGNRYAQQGHAHRTSRPRPRTALRPERHPHRQPAHRHRRIVHRPARRKTAPTTWARAAWSSSRAACKPASGRTRTARTAIPPKSRPSASSSSTGAARARALSPPKAAALPAGPISSPPVRGVRAAVRVVRAASAAIRPRRATPTAVRTRTSARPSPPKPAVWTTCRSRDTAPFQLVRSGPPQGGPFAFPAPAARAVAGAFSPDAVQPADIAGGIF